MREKLPTFLIIGAQKAGTTSLYNDLTKNPRVFIPDDKELGDLCHDHVLTPAGRSEYAAKFALTDADQSRGDATTAYTKRPRREGVAKRAYELLGPDLKMIYMVREPVSRTISHHHHLVAEQLVDPDINRAIHNHPPLIDYSRYAYQLEPWLAQFGAEAIRVVKFEDYVADRQVIVADLSRFIGVDPTVKNIDPNKVYNKTGSKPVALGAWRRIQLNPIYRGFVRTLIPPKTRLRLFQFFLPKAPPRPDPPSIETLDYIIERVRPNMDQLIDLLGPSAPRWDLDEVRTRYAVKTKHKRGKATS